MEKQTKNKILRYLGWGLIIWNVALKYVYAIAKLKFYPYRIAFPRADLSGFQVDFYLMAVNPTMVQMTFTGFRGKIWYDDLLISDTDIPRQTIYGKQRQQFNEIKISFWLTWQQVIADITSEAMIERFLNGTFMEGTLRIEGDFFIAGQSVPLKFNFKLNSI